MRYVALVLIVVVSSPAAQSAPPGDAFYEAVRTNDLTTLEALVRTHGVDRTDDSGQTPLMLAAAFGTTDALRHLLAAGASVGAKSGGGLTALHLALPDLEKTRLLVEAGADVNIATALGRSRSSSPRHRPARSRSCVCCSPEERPSTLATIPARRPSRRRRWPTIAKLRRSCSTAGRG